VWVNLLEPRAEFTDFEWSKLPGPPQPVTARGQVMREIAVPADRVTVNGEEIEPPFSELPPRLAEAAVVRIIDGIAHQGHNCGYDLDRRWQYDSPLSAVKTVTEP
jgi:hypothetical protein